MFETLTNLSDRHNNRVQFLRIIGFISPLINGIVGVRVQRLAGFDFQIWDTGNSFQLMRQCNSKLTELSSGIIKIKTWLIWYLQQSLLTFTWHWIQAAFMLLDCSDRRYLVPLKQNIPIICSKWLACLTRVKMTSCWTTLMHPNHRSYHSQHKSYNAETPRLAMLKVDCSYQVGLCTEVVKLLLD